MHELSQAAKRQARNITRSNPLHAVNKLGRFGHGCAGHDAACSAGQPAATCTYNPPMSGWTAVGIVALTMTQRAVPNMHDEVG